MATDLSLFVGEQLIAHATEAYEAPLPELSSFTLLPPTLGEGKGMAAIERMVNVHSGRAQIVGNATDDLPLVDVGSIRDLYPIKMVACAYRITLKEARAAQAVGMPLTSRKMMAARRALMESLNALFFYGDVHAGIAGLLRNSDIPRVLIPSSDVSAGATPDTVIAAILGMITQLKVNSGNTASPNVVGLPPSMMNFLAMTRSSTFTDRTLLGSLEMMSPGIRFVEVNEFENGGPTGGRVMAVLTLKPGYAEHVIPDLMTVLSEQDRNLATYVPVVAETAGFVTEFPRHHIIAEIV